MYCIVEINKDNRKRYITNNVRGYLPTTIVSFVMNLHPEPKPIYFTRHGQSEYNLEDRIGGDPNLTEFGRQYAKHLGKSRFVALLPRRFVASLEKVDVKRLAVWTSCKRRTVQTAMYIDCNSRVRWAALNEIDAGVCENLTYKEMGYIFQTLGCSGAANLDGGGSAQMLIRHPIADVYQIRNSPSDGSERPVINGWTVIVREP